ncbi:NUDIX domain-containing protein [Flavobacteriaceae bacterium R38]|nr:NUDIX domain-containing protein [Flavobacteriaceae bacterium R38]
MIIDKLAWIELKDQKILSTLSKGKDAYYIPGGKRETGESDTTALIREIKEELSVQLLPDSIKYVGTFQGQAHGHPNGVEVKMTCYAANYTGELKPDSEIEKIVWLSYSDLDKVSPVDKIIFEWLRKKSLLD